MKRLQSANLEALFSVLKAAGYAVIGPRLRDQAIVYEKISSAKDLPQGWTDDQEAGRYRLKRTESAAYFDYAASPHSWKQFLFLPRERLFRVEKRRDSTPRFIAEEPGEPGKIGAPKLAFFGVRSCDLVAIAVQDRVFIEGGVQDPGYQARRKAALLIAVECTSLASTCFCASMNTGPEARGGFDLVLTEVLGEHSHYFLVRAGSEKGEKVLKKLDGKGVLTDATPENRTEARTCIEAAAHSQQRRLDPAAARDILARNLKSVRWDEVAARCLTCANCTLVCPTCFCSSVEDVTDLRGDHAERWRRWDSCFTLDHSYIHGGSVRASVRSRYRQWLTHKLSSWWNQFGTSGCVGCGRCIAWCPVGIDITEETEAIGKYEENRGTA